MALTDQYIMHTYGRFPVAIDHGKGATLYDPEGQEYIDFTSGIGVTDLGYGNAALGGRHRSTRPRSWATCPISSTREPAGAGWPRSCASAPG